ncbi:MAG: ferritin family protein [Desulfobacterales bacterium]|nr:ferritin family protein [Desulfobacterales bacterium]
MDSAQYTQVISDAIQAEVEAKEFYEQVSCLIKDAHLSELFQDLAQEEARHERMLTQILKKGQIDSRYFDFEKDFNVAQGFDMPEVNADMDLKSAIGLAMKNEEIAMMKYMDLANNCTDPALEQVFLDLAAMERGHKFSMEEKFVDVAYPEVW